MFQHYFYFSVALMTISPDLRQICNNVRAEEGFVSQMTSQRSWFSQEE